MQLRFVLFAAWGLAGAGCGLVDNDTATVPVDLPDKTFTVDTQSWQLGDDNAHALLATSCAQMPTVCDSAAETACTGCSGACDDTSHTCDLTLAVSLYEAIDLAKEQPTLASVGTATEVRIGIDAVTYIVSSNSLDVDTPALTVYVGPQSVTTAGAMATPIATIAPVPAGDTTGTTALQFLGGGQDALSTAMSAYDTPFNLLVGGDIVLRGGDPAPTGKLEAKLHITAHAGL